MYLRYTASGHLYITPQDDCHAVVNAVLDTGYSEEFCLADDFSPEFAAGLMEAGFLLMSVNLAGEDEEAKPDYIMLPKLHLVRSALFFENLHVKKSIRRLLSQYELRANVEFERIVDLCVEKHGDDWLTPPLVECIKKIREVSLQEAPLQKAPLQEAASCDASEAAGRLVPAAGIYPASFALYRDGKLAAGEFGVACGRVYTSYSGFYDEDNAGTVQIILAARHLQEQGFSFFDLGMPLDYKSDLGAVNISPSEFVTLFREGQTL